MRDQFTAVKGQLGGIRNRASAPSTNFVTEKGSGNGLKVDIALACLIAGLAIALTLLWFSFDHRIPTQDEARHIMNGMTFRDLLLHNRPWQLRWWQRCLTVDPLYPPFVYAVNGLLQIGCGQSRFVEQLGVALFNGLLGASLYGLTRLVNGSRRAGCFAGLFGSTYPIMSTMSHTYFLDLPEAAMTVVALMVLLWWRRYPNPTIGRTLIAGALIGIACLTKQLVAIFVFPAGLYFLLNDLAIGLFCHEGILKRRKLSWSVHTFILGVVTAVAGLPFVLANLQWNIYRIHWNVQAFTTYGVPTSYLERLSSYGHQLSKAMSPLMLVVFLVSILSLNLAKYHRLIPVVISSFGGICLLSAFPSEGQDWRYLTPFLIAPAIMSGVLIDRFTSSMSIWRRSIGIAVVIIAVCSYFIGNFSPYPVPLVPELRSLSGAYQNPCRYADWGYSFVAETIKRTDGSKPVFLNILPNHDCLHVNAFVLFFVERKIYSIIPTSPRIWTIVGDLVKFDPTSARYPMWYLLKTGDTGFSFTDDKSRLAFAKLTEFVSNGKDYRLVDQKLLPDNTILRLYRRRM